MNSRGRISKKGTLVVAVRGCTPAYAGPEVHEIMKKLQSGMEADERNATQNLHIIDQSCHDIYGSSLTFLEGVFSSRDSIWSQGSDGPKVLQEYWGKLYYHIRSLHIYGA